MSGSATLATDRFRFATAATRISAMRTAPPRSGPDDASTAGVAGLVTCPPICGPRSRVALAPQPLQREEAEHRRQRERDPAEHEDGRECRVAVDAERGKASGQRGLLDADPTRDRSDAAEH